MTVAKYFIIIVIDDWEEIVFQSYDIRPYHWNRQSETQDILEELDNG